MVVAFDLDDTLYHEMEYVRSAYRAIARKYGAHLLPLMTKASTPADAFASTGVDIKLLLDIYRNHYPDIQLPMASLYTLSLLRNRGVTLALITDGREGTQSRKITALGLDKMIDEDLIYISEKFGEKKLTGGAMRKIMNKCPDDIYVYVGDNPEKDFVRGNELGWITVCLKASEDNIFPQNFVEISSEYHPRLIIHNLYEMVDFVNLVNGRRI